MLDYFLGIGGGLAAQAGGLRLALVHRLDQGGEIGGHGPDVAGGGAVVEHIERMAVRVHRGRRGVGFGRRDVLHKSVERLNGGVDRVGHLAAGLEGLARFAQQAAHLGFLAPEIGKNIGTLDGEAVKDLVDGGLALIVQEPRQPFGGLGEDLGGLRHVGEIRQDSLRLGLGGELIKGQLGLPTP